MTSPTNTPRASTPEPQQGTVRIRISATIDNEYATRCPEELSALDKLNTGICELTPAQALEVLADAEFNADRQGGPEYMPIGTRRAYRALAGQIRKALATIGCAATPR